MYRFGSCIIGKLLCEGVHRRRQKTSDDDDDRTMTVWTKTNDDEAQFESISVQKLGIIFILEPKGRGSKMNGAKGEDVVVKVPPGTVVRALGEKKVLLGDSVVREYVVKKALLVARSGMDEWERECLRLRV
ncbi:GTP-binding protein OBGC, chloroplastic [Tanacetum coccineum]|uniref:GTP-binding protein OBGC, chloroplastic n=1 Tax=Tanacetum coccineum TaxID=301880 RepID=A0ABQ5FR46_9ASTR